MIALVEKRMAPVRVTKIPSQEIGWVLFWWMGEGVEMSLSLSVSVGYRGSLSVSVSVRYSVWGVWGVPSSRLRDLAQRLNVFTSQA